MDLVTTFLPLLVCGGLITAAGSTLGILWLCSTYFYSSSSTSLRCWWSFCGKQDTEMRAGKAVHFALRSNKIHSNHHCCRVND